VNGQGLVTDAVETTATHPTRVGAGNSAVGQSPTATTARPRVSVVIPTLNEAKNLPHVFATLPADIFEVVLVDGRSTDDTVEVARDLYPDVRIVGQTGKGKGNALACGFAACRGDVIVMLDADGSANGQEIPRFVDALVAGADFAKGSRFAEGGGSSDITPLRGAGNWFFSTLVNVLFGTRYSDLCYGYNAFWAHCLPHMSVDCDGFEVETLINIRVARSGLTIAEVPSFEEDRIHGESNLRTFRDGFRVLRTIFRERLKGSGSSSPVMGSAPESALLAEASA
jgi:glycosyltransferase involved in cell wall biosynthesis